MTTVSAAVKPGRVELLVAMIGLLRHSVSLWRNEKYKSYLLGKLFGSL
jgi:hypothetical protein